MAKRYNRRNWVDAPSTNTPRNAANLNWMDKGIDDLDNAIEDVQGQINQLVISGDSSVEAAQARVATDQTFETLKERLDNSDSQLAEIENEVNINTTAIQQIDSGMGGSYASLALLQAAYPTGDTKRHVVLGSDGVKEVDTLVVTAIPTVAGNLSITLNGVTKTVAVDPATDTTTTLVATKIRAVVFTGWTISGTGANIIYTKNTIGTNTPVVFSAGSTAHTATFTLTTAGVASSTSDWYYWSGTEWLDGGVYQSVSNAETTDIRTGENGTVYDTAGKAVRGQFAALKKTLSALHGKYDVVEGKTSQWGTNSVFYVDCDLKKGEIIKGQILSYTGTKFKNLRIVGYDSNNVEYSYPSNPNIGEVQNLKAKTNFVKIMFQINTTEIEVCDYQVFYTLEDTKTINLVKSDIHREYYVKKDGTGDFTKLTDAITEACKYMDSKVYVGAGTWNLIDELGNSYVESVSYIQRGIYLKNRVHVIFSSKALVTCHYTGTRADTITWLSAFNAGIYGFTLENLILETSKCRYSIHDERDSDTDTYVNKYIHCNVKHDNTNGGFRQCIGGGLGTDGYVVIDGCTFDNPRVGSVGDLVSYHNSAGAGKSHVEIKNSYFKRVFTFRFSWYGQSTEKSTMLACGNSIGASIIHQAETVDGTSPNANTELVEWNNIVRS